MKKVKVKKEKERIILLGITIEEFPKPLKTLLNIWKVTCKNLEGGVLLQWEKGLVQIDVNPYKKRETDEQILIHQVIIYIRGGSTYVEALVDLEDRTTKIRKGEASGKFR